jgi:hypothetical protein
MATKSTKSELSLEEFKSLPAPDQWQRLVGKISGGTFLECHMRVRAETGIWIEELTPVFLKLDALTARK